MTRAWSGISRRGFLSAGAVGLGALGITASWLWLRTDDRAYRAMVGGAVPVVLTVGELAILEALADAIVEPAPGAPTARQAQTARRIDRELFFHKGSKELFFRRGGKLVSDVKLSLSLIEWLPVASFAGRKFTALSAADKVLFLRGCETSRWSIRSQAFSGLKFLILFFYYTDDRTWPSIGYAGPTVPEKFFEGGNRISNLSAISAGGDHS